MARRKISRSQAKAAGLKRYFTGQPCPQGHITDRLMINGQCVDCNAQSTAAWRQNNKDKISEDGAKYRTDPGHKKKQSKYMRAYRIANRERLNAYHRARYAAKRDKS